MLKNGIAVFAKPLMDLIHVWHYDRNLSKILRSTIPTPVHDQVKVTGRLRIFMLNVYSVSFCKGFIFGMNRHALQRKSMNSGELSCPATHLILHILIQMLCWIDGFCFHTVLHRLYWISCYTFINIVILHLHVVTFKIAESDMSNSMTEPAKWPVHPARLGSAWASAQSDQSSLSAWRNNGSLATRWVCRLSHDRIPGWSESSLGARVILLDFVERWLILM